MALSDSKSKLYFRFCWKCDVLVERNIYILILVHKHSLNFQEKIQLVRSLFYICLSTFLFKLNLVLEANATRPDTHDKQGAGYV